VEFSRVTGFGYLRLCPQTDARVRKRTAPRLNFASDLGLSAIGFDCEIERVIHRNPGMQRRGLVSKAPLALTRHRQHESSRGEAITKHRQTADGLDLSRLILQNVPMLFKKTVFESDNVGGNPCRGPSVS
jgi:hypothetical protein